MKSESCQSSGNASLKIQGPQIGDSIGDWTQNLWFHRRLSSNLSWGKYGVWLVDWWIHSLCVFLWLSVHSILRFWCDDFLCLTVIFIWDINVLMTLIVYLACLSIVTLILPWWFYSPHMYRLIVVYIPTGCVDSLACILSWSSLNMLSLSLFVLIVIFSFSLCVDMDDIFALCLTVCCMTALLLCFCMLLVCVGHITILLPPTLWFRSFPLFRLLFLQVWDFMCVYFSDRASDKK